MKTVTTRISINQVGQGLLIQPEIYIKNLMQFLKKRTNIKYELAKKIYNQRPIEDK